MEPRGEYPKEPFGQISGQKGEGGERRVAHCGCFPPSLLLLATEGKEGFMKPLSFPRKFYDNPLSSSVRYKNGEEAEKETV